MEIVHMPNDITPLIDLIKGTLAESQWPQVMAALRQDPLVWKSVLNPGFREQIAGHLTGSPQNWSPGHLALLTLEAPWEPGHLREAPSTPIPADLARQAQRAFEQLFKRSDLGTTPQGEIQSTGEPSPLATAGLVALAMRERYREQGTWDGFLPPVSEPHLPVVRTAVACLYSFLPEPYGYLANLLAPGASVIRQTLALHALLSNPIDPDHRKNLLHALLEPLEAEERVTTLETLAAHQPALARELAARLLTGWEAPGAANLDAFTHLKQLVIGSDLHHMAGESQQAIQFINQAWEILRQLQVRLAVRLAKNASRNGDSLEDRITMVSGWEQATRLSGDSPSNLANYALALMKAGHWDAANNLLPATSNHPDILYAIAYLAHHGPQQDIPRARQVASKALSAYLNSAAETNPAAAVARLHALARLLLDLGLPYEARRVARAALENCPNDPDFLTTLGQAHQEANELTQAIEATRLAVLLAPDRLDLRQRLAEQLETTGHWEDALQERTILLERGATPSVAELRALANCALKAGQIDLAIQMCDQALQIDPGDGLSYALLGEAHIESGDVTRGMDCLRQATQLSPHQPAAWLSLARAQEQSGDRARAMETLRTATHAVPESAVVHAALGHAYLAQEHLTQAVVCYQRGAELAPEDPRIALPLGNTLRQLGRLEDARETLARAFQVRPQDAELALAYGRVLLDLEEPRAALPALIVVIQSNPDSHEPYFDYARALLATGEGAQEAVEALTRVLEKEPDNLEAQALMAEALQRSGDYQEASKLYQALLDSDLGRDPAWQTHLSLGLGEASLHLGQWEAAIASLQAGLENDPDNPHFYRHLAKAYQAANLGENALEAARDALRLKADDLDTLTWFAGMAIELDAQEEARSALKQAIELAPQRADLLVLLGQTMFRTGDQAGAWEAFQQVLNHTAASPADLHAAANGFQQLEDYTSAKTCLQRAIEASGTPPVEWLSELAAAQHQSGNTHAAIETIDQALESQPGDATLHLTKARFLQALNRPQAAMACLQHAINLAPEDVEAHAQAAMLLRATQDLPAALSHAEKWVQIAPSDLAARYLAADLARAMLQEDYARRILQDGWPRDKETADDMADLAHNHVPYFCLYGELALDAGEEIRAAEALTEAVKRAPEEARVIALQARLNACKGDLELARGLLNRLVDSRTQERKSLENLDLEAASVLAIGDAGVELALWELALAQYSRALSVLKHEPYPNLRLAQALVLRAEKQRFCQEVGATQHAPGEEALSEYARQQFETAIETATHRTSSPAKTQVIARWKARGAAIFGLSIMSQQDLNLLSQEPEEVAARMAALNARGDVSGAVATARSFPLHPLVLAHLALALIDENPREALTAARMAADRKNDDPLYQALLARVASQAGDITTPLQAIQKALAIWPDEPRWHATAAALYQQADEGDVELHLAQAISHLEAATRLEPEQVSHPLQLGLAYMAVGEVQKAIETLKAAVHLAPDQAPPWLSLARAHRANGDLEEAGLCAEKAMVISSASTAPHVLRAEIALDENNPQEALNRIQAALRLAPDDPEALVIKAHALEALQRPTEALEVIEQALRQPDPPLPLMLRRVTLLRQAQGSEAALEALRELADGYPDNPIVLAALTDALLEANRREEAIGSARRALKLGVDILSPTELARLHHTLGRLLRQSGHLDQAIHHLSEAIHLDPDGPDPYLELGRTHLERREYEEALLALQGAIQVAPDDPRPYIQAGVALKECKDYVKAESMLRKAAELSPNDLSVHRLLGAVVALNIVHNNREASVDV